MDGGGSDGTGISLVAACPYLVPVSLALLESPDTHRHELLALCAARALPVDTNASKAVLRARLVAFNLSTRTVWCARVQLLAKHVGGTLSWTGPVCYQFKPPWSTGCLFLLLLRPLS